VEVGSNTKSRGKGKAKNKMAVTLESVPGVPIAFFATFPPHPVRLSASYAAAVTRAGTDD